MDEKLRASFIPKQPLVGHDVAVPRRRRRSGGGSPFFYISLGVLLLSLLSWGGVFVWQKIVENSIKEKSASLESMREQFRPADIARYKRLDDRIKVAFERLESHLVVHPLFILLNESTLPEVQYTSFTFARESIVEEPTDGAPEFGESAPLPISRTDYRISIKAEADSFETISLQSRIFKDIEFFKDPKFSNFTLDEISRVISFDIDATVDPRLINYSDVVARSGQVNLEIEEDVLDNNPVDTEGVVEEGDEAGDVVEAVSEENLGEEEVISPNE